MSEKTDSDPHAPRTETADRRRFLGRVAMYIAGAAAAVIGLPVFAFVLAPLSRKAPRVWRVVGAKDHFAIGDTVLVKFEDPTAEGWSGVTAQSAAWLRRVGRDDFIAFSVNCTHLGCPVRWEPGAELFMCPCHGGVYYEDGTVAAGPPPESLRRYRARIRNGNVEIETRPIPIT
jgi:menaquinol-cytochrome c reductase iron-sulfur subunit